MWVCMVNMGMYVCGVLNCGNDYGNAGNVTVMLVMLGICHS